jgi:hypothetical protein
MLDLYELILSTHTDYAQLRLHLADAGAENPARPGLQGGARYRIGGLRRHPRESLLSRNQLRHRAGGIEAELAVLQQRIERRQAAQEALAVLRAQRNKIRAIIKMIGELHAASQKVADTTPFWADADMGPFLSQQKYELRMMLSHLRLRRSSASRCGWRWRSRRVWLWLRGCRMRAQLLDRADHRDHPQAQLQHDQAAPRDRIVGTVIGCVITALIIQFLNYPAAILGA